MAELAPDFTPYRYEFNNPVFWSDASGLFESYGAAQSWIDKWGLTGAEISYNRYKGVYEIANEGVSFYQRGEDIISSMYSMETGLTIDITKGGASGGGDGTGNSSNRYHFLYNKSIYNFLANNPAVSGYGSGEYGPYTGDADGISLSIGAWGSSFGVSLVLDKYNNFD